MPKQKTPKGCSKVFKKKSNGKLSYEFSNGNHQTNKDNAKQVRKRRNKGILAKGNAKAVKKVI